MHQSPHAERRRKYDAVRWRVTSVGSELNYVPGPIRQKEGKREGESGRLRNNIKNAAAAIPAAAAGVSHESATHEYRPPPLNSRPTELFFVPSAGSP